MGGRRAKAPKATKPPRNRRPRQLRAQPKLTGQTEPISLYPLSFDEAMRRLVKP